MLRLFKIAHFDKTLTAVQTRVAARRNSRDSAARFDFHHRLSFQAFPARERMLIMASTAVRAKKRRKFDLKRFLSTIDGGRKIAAFAKKQTIFVQGDLSNAVFYIQSGKIKLTV